MGTHSPLTLLFPGTVPCAVAHELTLFLPLSVCKIHPRDDPSLGPRSSHRIAICRDRDRAWTGRLGYSHVFIAHHITEQIQRWKGEADCGLGVQGPALSCYHIQEQNSEQNVKIQNLNLVFQTIIIHVR